LLDNVPHMLFAEEDDLVQTLSSCCADPGLGK